MNGHRSVGAPCSVFLFLVFAAFPFHTDAACSNAPADWIEFPVEGSETWPTLNRRILATNITTNEAGDEILYILQFVATFGTRPFLASVNLDDPYRRWQVTELPADVADSGSNSAGHLLYARRTNDLYFIDRANDLQHWNGTSWTNIMALNKQGHIYGFGGTNEMVVVSFDGSWIYEDGVWEDVSSTLTHPGGGDYGLWRNGYRDYFVVTAFGVFQRWQNGSVTVIDTMSTKQITSVFGFAPDDVYIIQFFGLNDPRIRHYDGSTVTTVWDEEVPNDGKLWELTGLSNGTLVATGEGGDGGVIVTRESGVWSCATVSNTIWSLSNGGRHLVAAGNDAMVLHRGELSTAWPRTYNVTGGPTLFRYKFKSSLREAPSSFAVEVSPNLGADQWLPTSTTINPDGDYHEALIFVSPTWDHRVYRVVETPGP